MSLSTDTTFDNGSTDVVTQTHASRWSKRLSANKNAGWCMFVEIEKVQTLHSYVDEYCYNFSHRKNTYFTGITKHYSEHTRTQVYATTGHKNATMCQYFSKQNERIGTLFRS